MHWRLATIAAIAVCVSAARASAESKVMLSAGAGYGFGAVPVQYAGNTYELESAHGPSLDIAGSMLVPLSTRWELRPRLRVHGWFITGADTNGYGLGGGAVESTVPCLSPTLDAPLRLRISPNVGIALAPSLGLFAVLGSVGTGT